MTLQWILIPKLEIIYEALLLWKLFHLCLLIRPRCYEHQLSGIQESDPIQARVHPLEGTFGGDQRMFVHEHQVGYCEKLKLIPDQVLEEEEGQRWRHEVQG